jgi:DNA-3-methyladenine glycosylase II
MKRETIKRHLDELAQHDADLRRGLRRAGYPAPRIRPPGFETLLATVVSQQISTDAAAAITQRLRQKLPSMSAEAVLRLPPGGLRAAGLSAPKAGYIEGLARAVADGSFSPARLADMDDETAVAAITALRGFGAWSAEIYLMFSLQRSDVFPAGDLALRTALARLKGIDEKLSQAAARELVAAWAPYRSAGSLFLWHYYRGAPV